MKTKKYIILLLSFLSVASFIACKNEPIFAAIEKEVELKDFSIESNVIGFAEIGNTIYAANTKAVYTKTVGASGEWKSIGTPKGTELIQGIAVESGKLLVSVATEITDNSDGSIKNIKGKVSSYNPSNKTWTDISNNAQLIYGDSKIFAFDYNTKKIYTITTSAKEINTLSKNERLIAAADNYYATTGKDKDGNYVGKIYTGTAQVNELKDLKQIKDLCTGPGTKLMIIADGKIYQYDGTSLKAKELKNKKPISLFYFKDENTLLIGCEEGYTELKFDATNDVAKATEISPGKDGSTTPKAVYSQFNSIIGNTSFKPIFAVKNAKDYSIFAGIHASTALKNNGLWAYHSNGKQEWNRD